TPVAAPVGVTPVAIVFAVGFVVLALVAHEVAQREAVVAGDEVDAGVRTASGGTVEVAAPGQPVGQVGHLAGVAAPEAPHPVPILAVPLRPAHRKVPHLVAAGTQVPGLGDQLHA